MIQIECLNVLTTNIYLPKEIFCVSSLGMYIYLSAIECEKNDPLFYRYKWYLPINTKLLSSAQLLLLLQIMLLGEAVQVVGVLRVPARILARDLRLPARVTLTRSCNKTV